MESIDWRLIKVLVVDDDDTVRRTLAKFFEKIGCVGAYASNGADAIKLVKKYNFDLCFMDLFMPEMGGVEATQMIHDTADPKIPIIALTSSSMDVDKEKCSEIGMQDYVQKPVDLDLIKDIIERYGVKREE